VINVDDGWRHVRVVVGVLKGIICREDHNLVRDPDLGDAGVTPVPYMVCTAPDARFPSPSSHT